MRRITVWVLVLSLSIPANAWAQAVADAAPPAGTPADRVADDPGVAKALQLLETWLDAELAYKRIPGLSAAIVHDQNIVWARGFGFADLERRQPATPQTIYSICSISKLFTSIAVMQQRDAGNLRLDDEIRDHLPWFDIEESHADSGRATLRGVLTHSSGLPRESAHPYWTGPEFLFPTREQITESDSRQQTLYPADTYLQYSNLGLTLAGETVAAVSGQRYADYIQEHILGPLDMSSTTTEIPADEAGGRLATGYGPLRREGSREQVPVFQARGISPAAGFASTVEDLAKFASWQFRLLASGETEVLAANTLREMHRVHWVDEDWSAHWGLGFSVSRSDDTTFVGHGGSCPGFRSSLTLQPRDRVAVTVMANALGVNPGLYARRAYEIVGPALSAAAEADAARDEATADSADLDPDNSELERYVGLYRSTWGESAIVLWEDGLASMSLPTDDPLGGLTKLTHIEGNTFHRVRDNGEPGEEWVFEVDTSGAVTRLRQHGNYSEKVR